MIKTDANSTKEFFEKAIKERVISEDRKSLLTKIATQIAKEYKERGNVNLNFICTHNSRRSQLGQVWGYFAAHYFKLQISSFSGGTEVTAFHRNTVKTLKSVGFSFDIQEFSHQNPVYQISFEGAENYTLGFSKIFDHQVNKTPFIAVTTCDSADENCPFIAEAIYRFHLPYTDPKYSDNTPEQEEAYLLTNKEVASEVHFIFSKVASLV